MQKWKLVVALALGFLAGQHTSVSAEAPAARTPQPARRVSDIAWQSHFERTSVKRSRQPLAPASFTELIRQVAPVAQDAPLRYSDFEAYMQAANTQNQRTGKVFEAVLTERANRHLIASGSRSRVFALAAEGFPTHPMDLAEVGPDGVVAKHYQAKYRMGYRAFARHLNQPKYEGMIFVATRESFHRIEDELIHVEANALRRNVPVPLTVQRVRSAVSDGRLADRWYGKPLPSERGVGRITRRETQKVFEQLRGAQLSTAARTSLPGSAALPKLLLGADVLVEGYAEFIDVSRYARGETSGAALGIKSVLRGAQISLTTYALFSPEPVSRFTSGAVAVALITADVATEYACASDDARREVAIRNLLAGVERAERYHAVRAHLKDIAAGHN